jgi:hypothetical protein
VQLDDKLLDVDTCCRRGESMEEHALLHWRKGIRPSLRSAAGGRHGKSGLKLGRSAHRSPCRTRTSFSFRESDKEDARSPMKNNEANRHGDCNTSVLVCRRALWHNATPTTIVCL